MPPCPHAPATRPAAGGVLRVCFWPQIVEERGPWQLLTALTASFRPQTDWERGIPGDALAEGAQLLQVGRCGCPGLPPCRVCRRGAQMNRLGLAREQLTAWRTAIAHRFLCVLAAACIAGRADQPSDGVAQCGVILGWHDPSGAMAQVWRSSCCCRPTQPHAVADWPGSRTCTPAQPARASQMLLFASPWCPSCASLHCSRRLAFGDEHMEELRQKFMEQPEYSDPAAPVQHTATARLVCLKRLQAQAAL